LTKILFILSFTGRAYPQREIGCHPVPPGGSWIHRNPHENITLVKIDWVRSLMVELFKESADSNFEGTIIDIETIGDFDESYPGD